MEGSLRYSRRRSGYEPSDTETDWPNSPERDTNARFTTLKIEAPISSLPRRRHSKSPYKPRADDGNPHSPLHNSSLRRNVSPLPLSRRTHSVGGNISPFSKSEHRKNLENRGNVGAFSKSECRRHVLDNDETLTPSLQQNLKVVNHDVTMFEKSSHSRRAISAPRSNQRIKHEYDQGERRKGDRNIDASHKHGPSGGEINEMVANAKISKWLDSRAPDPNFESTDSISPGDIFFSREYIAFQNVAFSKNGGVDKRGFHTKPQVLVDRNANARPNLVNKVDSNLTHSSRSTSQTTTNPSAPVSRQNSYVTDSSGRTSVNTNKFVANRQKSQTEPWFSCLKNGSCRTSKKSPEKDRHLDESSFIEKAVVIENIRPFWADKHQPASLNGFTCHKKEALLLQQLVSNETFPHILLKGPPGAGKKALTMALLRQIYGDPVWNISHDLRYFHILESKPMQVVVPLSSSTYHVELNVYLEPKSAYALTALVKQISSEYAVPPEISTVMMKTDFKVLVLYDVDKAAENIQHLVKWIMDCYSDSCKLILCCEDDVDILEWVKSRCKVINVEAPVTHELLSNLHLWRKQIAPDQEYGFVVKLIIIPNFSDISASIDILEQEIMEVLIQIANKEGFELSMNFAAKIAIKSKQNLRRAIMALEACKAHNYPFSEDQPIPIGWEEAVVELAADILANPLPNRLFVIRGKIQKLLADFVHPKLILLKLVEQFLRAVEANLKRAIYYWHAYYDKRLPTGTSALLKLEEFVAKFMSIYRKNSRARQFS